MNYLNLIIDNISIPKLSLKVSKIKKKKIYPDIKIFEFI